MDQPLGMQPIEAHYSRIHVLGESGVILRDTRATYQACDVMRVESSIRSGE
jgi:hypothetical protein